LSAAAWAIKEARKRQRRNQKARRGEGKRTSSPAPSTSASIAVRGYLAAIRHWRRFASRGGSTGLAAMGPSGSLGPPSSSGLTLHRCTAEAQVSILKHYGVPQISMLEAFRPLKRMAPFLTYVYYVDNLHPSALGHKMIASALAFHLTPGPPREACTRLAPISGSSPAIARPPSLPKPLQVFARKLMFA